MRVESDHYVFVFDEPAGREGLDLFRRASAIIAECDWTPPMAAGDPSKAAAIIDRFIFSLAGHREGERILLLTFSGATVETRDGSAEPVAFSKAWVDRLPITHAKDPYDALWSAWVQLGFFGSGLREAMRQGAEHLAKLKAEATPTSE